MKNLKQVAFGLLLGAMAIGFSAFTTAKKIAAVTYYQTSVNNYEKLANPEGICDPDQSTSNSCTITYATDPGVSSFTYATKPAGGTESSEKRLYAQ